MNIFNKWKQHIDENNERLHNKGLKWRRQKTKSTVKQGNFGNMGNCRFFNPLPLLALLCLWCMSQFLLICYSKETRSQVFLPFSGPLPSRPSDFQPVLKNCQSWFYMIIKLTSQLMTSGEISLFLNPQTIQNLELFKT